MRTKLNFLLSFIYVFPAAIIAMGDDSNIAINYNTCYLFDGAIAALTLVDADTNQDLYDLRDGLEINEESIKGRHLNIRLKLLPYAEVSNIKRVDFILEGAMNTKSSEFQLPFALFGDIDGDYKGQMIKAGTYNVWVGVADHPDTDHYWDTLGLKFKVGAFKNAISGFYGIESEYNQISGEVLNGGILNYADNPFSFEARSKTYGTGSVAMELNGPVSFSRIENQEPFTLFGDEAGSFNGMILPEGEYSLSAIPYSGPNGAGEAGPEHKLTFTVEFDADSFSLSTFANLVAADTKENLSTFFVFNKTIVDQKVIPTSMVNIMVHPNVASIASVEMILLGPVSHNRIENVAPFMLFGDKEGTYNAENLLPGSYSLRVTPFTGPNATQKAGISRVFEFEILDSGHDPALEKSVNSSPYSENDEGFIVSPNPAHEYFTVKPAKNNDIPVHALVYDLTGKRVMELHDLSGNTIQEVNTDGLKPGIYIIEIHNGAKKPIVKKVVVQ